MGENAYCPDCKYYQQDCNPDPEDYSLFCDSFEEELCSCGHPASEHKNLDECRFEDCTCKLFRS